MDENKKESIKSVIEYSIQLAKQSYECEEKREFHMNLFIDNSLFVMTV